MVNRENLLTLNWYSHIQAVLLVCANCSFSSDKFIRYFSSVTAPDFLFNWRMEYLIPNRSIKSRAKCPSLYPSKRNGYFCYKDIFRLFSMFVLVFPQVSVFHVIDEAGSLGTCICIISPNWRLISCRHLIQLLCTAMTCCDIVWRDHLSLAQFMKHCDTPNITKNAIVSPLKPLGTILPLHDRRREGGCRSAPCKFKADIWVDRNSIWHF